MTDSAKPCDIFQEAKMESVVFLHEQLILLQKLCHVSNC